MKRIAYWALPLLLVSALAAPSFAQQTDPKWKDNKEYDDWMLIFNEKDLPKKAANAEKFFTDHKDADPLALTQAYQMMILSYAQGGNWAKTIDTVERMELLAPKLDPATKLQYMGAGMVAAANLKNTAKTKEYAEKILAGSPNDINALITLSGLLSQTLPTANGPAKDAQLVKTLEITNRGLAQPKPKEVTDAQWNPIQLQLHQTACLMLLNQTKYTESMAECQAALKINSKDSYSWYLIGLSKKAELVDRVKKYTEALNRYNAGRDQGQIIVEDLRSIMDGAEKVASDKKDETLDAFARSVAAGGPVAPQAREELQKLFTGTPDELNRLIEEKKSQLGN